MNPSQRSIIVQMQSDERDVTEQEDQFRVVFDGSLTGDYSLENTKLRFGKVFGLFTEKINRYFSGKAITLKSNLTEDGAMGYAVKLVETRSPLLGQHTRSKRTRR